MPKFILTFLFVCSSLCAYEILPYGDSTAALEYAKKYLPDNPIIIECGGYNGHDTIKMSNLWPQGIVHTFEPIPSLMEIIKQNTSHLNNVLTYHLALGDYFGPGTFYVSTHQGEICGSSSLLPPDEHTDMTPYIEFNETITVLVVPLDLWALWNSIEKIDFMWLDMQGYELNMLKVSELAKTAKAIFTEIEFIPLYEGQYLYPDVLQWMEENDFELGAMDCEVNHPWGFGNALFVKRN